MSRSEFEEDFCLNKENGSMAQEWRKDSNKAEMLPATVRTKPETSLNRLKLALEKLAQVYTTLGEKLGGVVAQ